MIEKIKKLVESSNYEDNRIALIPIAENYSIEELYQRGDRDDSGVKLKQFGINTDTTPNGLILDNGYFICHTSRGHVFVSKDASLMKEDDYFIKWEVESK